MSLEVCVYCPSLDDELIPEIEKRLNNYDMNVEICPDFSLVDNGGFISFKFTLNNPPTESLKGKELISSLETYVSDFDLQSVTDELNPKRGFFSRFFGFDNKKIQFAPTEVEDKLRTCHKQISFVWHGGESFQLRFTLLVTAILNELVDGVCNYPADNIWYINGSIEGDPLQEITEYEQSLVNSDSLEFEEFNGWL